MLAKDTPSGGGGGLPASTPSAVQKATSDSQCARVCTPCSLNSVSQKHSALVWLLVKALDSTPRTSAVRVVLPLSQQGRLRKRFGEVIIAGGRTARSGRCGTGHSLQHASSPNHRLADKLRSGAKHDGIC
jgi:hypothetical protein